MSRLPEHTPRPQHLLELLSQAERSTLPAAAASENSAGLFAVEEVDGYARLDHGRGRRTGLPEVLFTAGKTPGQAAEIFARMAAAAAADNGDVLATRASEEHAAAILARTPAAEHNRTARTLSLLRSQPAEPQPVIAVLCAGTSDLPVAEEAAVTAEVFGCRVTRLYDVGVAGLHRLLACLPQLEEAGAVIVCAGMEGALPSVVGGLVGVPVLAVPTSVGYGASFGGVTALLGMLNSCSPNVSVVNIDNGFGAAYTATLIARGKGSPRAAPSASNSHSTTNETSHSTTNATHPGDRHDGT